MTDRSAANAPVDPIGPVDAAVCLLFFATALLLYRATAPAQVNLDGLGYLKLLPHNFSAGHLLYMPLLRALAARRGDALAAGRALDSFCAAASVALCWLTARSMLARLPSALAAAGLAVSYGVWVQGADVECYAPALLALMLLWSLLLAWRALCAPTPSLECTIAVGLALACAALTHLTHLLATPLVVAWLIRYAPSRRAGLVHAAIALATGGSLAAASYAYAAWVVRYSYGYSSDLLAWVGTAQHGFRYDGTALQRITDSAYGLARALVWSPYLYESNAQTLLGQFLLGLTAAATLLAAIATQARRPRVAALPLAMLALWALPYAAMALAFFGSDHERWLFVLPPLWIAGAAALAALGSARGAIAGAILVLGIAAINRASAIAPAMEWTWDRTRADAATEPMRDGDLVLFPGHSWDEYVGFHSGRRIVPLPIAYYAGVLGRDGCISRIERDVRGARRRGARVWAVRLLDNDGDERGFFELAQLGFTRAELRRLVERFRVTPFATSQRAVTVYRLDDRPPPPDAADAAGSH